MHTTQLSSARYCRKTHFTLVEIVLAIAILLMIVGIAMLALSSAEQTLRKVKTVNHRLQQYQAIDRLVNRAFKNAIYFTWPDKNSRQQLLFDGQAHALFLCYLHRISPNSHSALRFLKLYLENQQLIAEYSDTPLLPEDENSPTVKREIIASGISEITFLYAKVNPQSQTVNLLDHWDTQQEHYIPAGIQLQIKWENGQSERWFRRTAGAGYSQQRGRR